MAVDKTSPVTTDVSPADRVVGAWHTYQGELHVMTAQGKLFKYERDTYNYAPGVHYRWTHIEGPKL